AARHLLLEHHLLDRRGAPAAVLLGPRHARPAAVMELAGPRPRRLEVVAAALVAATRGPAVVVGQVGLEPGPELGPERLRLGRVLEVHRSPFVRAGHYGGAVTARRGPGTPPVLVTVADRDGRRRQGVIA